MPKKFEQDCRIENPGLHLLYVKWACKNLAIVDRALESLETVSQWAMAVMAQSLIDARAKLVRTDAAYADAEEILQSLKPEENNEQQNQKS